VSGPITFELIIKIIVNKKTDKYETEADRTESTLYDVDIKVKNA
jgi:hypothetical protein